jgi:hypothetical protein
MGVAMSAPEVEFVPAPSITVENPAFAALVEDRGTRLCLSAEPHSHSPASTAPCEVHRSEARRGLMGQWLGQQDQVA